MANKTWTMNETQMAFVGALKDGQIKSLKQVNSLPDAVEYNVKVVEVRTYADGTEITIEKTKVAYETGYQLA